MLRYIPDFILHKYEQMQFSGSFNGYALFFDIADFTPIGTQLQKHGKEGAEELSRFLDFVFGQPIRIVEGCGGFVSHFAGDAFCAIFPEASGLGILAAVNAIREFFKDKESYHTPLGDFALKVRQTIAWGEIHWQIYDNPSQSEYVFYGDTLAEMAELSAKKEDCIFSAEALKRLGYSTVAELSKAPCLAEVSAMHQQNPAISYSHNPETYSHFIQQRLLSQNPDNEIRGAAFCFVSLEAIPREERNEAVAKLATLSQNYGAYVNKLDATDKGLTALILFGLPRSEGKTLERICSFALEAVEALPLLALGISCGSVFAGYTGSGEISEYTAFGHPLNLAARLMSKARAGEVLTDTYLWQELHASYDFFYLGSLNLKGIEQPIRYYRIKQLTQRSHREEQRFVGRDTELNSIRETIDKALAAKENLVLYISGDAGIGKSRLVSEALAIYGVENSDSPQPNRNSAAPMASQCQLYYITCDAILRKPLEAIKQMLRSQFYYNSSLPMAAAIPMFRALWGTICPGDSEMQRIESFLASLLGYEWEGSIWSMLPAEERPKQLKNAFVYFIRKLCKSGEQEFSTPFTGKAILIHLDDGQWLDEESQSYFQALSEADICPVIFISPCRYLEDGNKADLQLPKHQRKDIELDSLSENGCLELTKSIMRLNEIPLATQELIYNRSMGNPLFIEQLSSYLMETGSLNAKGEIVQELGYLSSFSISDIVSNRIDRLTDKVKECLFSASVLGMEFNIKVLSEMLKTDLTKELEAGTNSRIWKDLDELRYIFSHILIKDIVYQSMMSEKLKGLHKLAVEAMEIVYHDKLDESAEEIAFHCDRAGMEVKAGQYYYNAGLRYCEMYKLITAEACLNKSLQFNINTHKYYSEQCASVLSALAEAYLELGKHQLAKEKSVEAIKIFEAINGLNHISTAFPRLRLSLAYKFDGDMTNSYLSMIEVLEIREKALGFEHPAVAMTLAHLIGLHLFFQEHEKAEEVGRRALAIMRQDGIVNHKLAFVLYRLAEALISTGKYLEAEELFLRALTIYDQQQPDHPETVKILCSYSRLCRCQKNSEKAESLSKKAVKISNSCFGEEHRTSVFALNELAAVYIGIHKYQKAITVYKHVLEIAHSSGIDKHPVYALCHLQMGFAYHALSMQKEAEPHYLYAYDYYQKSLTAYSSLRLTTTKLLVNLYQDLNELCKVEMFKSVLPPDQE